MTKNHIQVFDVQNMSCVSCAVTIEKVLREHPDVTAVDVNFALGRATIEGTIGADAVQQIVHNLGYEASPLLQQLTKQRPDGRLKTIICMILALPFLLEMAEMLTDWNFSFPLSLQFGLASIIQFYFGFPFYQSAYHALRVGSWNMDFLVILGTSSAWGLSTYRWLMVPDGEVYFEASALVISFVLVGRWLEELSKRATHAALTTLSHLRPETARVWRHQSFMIVPANQLILDELILVRPGERVPCDGIVEKGESQVDQSLLTGENLPISLGEGAEITGGVLNLTSPLHIRIKHLQDDSRLQKIIELVAETASSKPPIQRLVDRASSLFTPIVLAIAVATFVGWILTGLIWDEALIRAVTVLVIACPCALGLAAPTAMIVGSGIAATQGILTKRPAVLELFTKATLIIFDKTGTLTLGKPSVIHMESVNTNEADLIRLVASLQVNSPHPIAHAVMVYAAQNNITPIPVEQFQAIHGRGLEARIDGARVLVGSRQYMTENSIDTFPHHAIFTKLADAGKTIFWIARGHELMGFMAIQDQLRPSAKIAIDMLHRNGFKVMMLSGDALASAQGIGAQLGIDTVVADQTPEKKAAYIRNLQSQGETVIMVGDGVNDAPALVLADISIAMGSGTDVARDTASFSLMRDDLTLVPFLISLARNLTRTIKQNLFWAFFYNSLCIPLAIFGIVTPVFAGAAMAASDICVIGNSLLLKIRIRR